MQDGRQDSHKGGGAQDTQVQRIRAEAHQWMWPDTKKHWQQHSVTFDSELVIRTTGKEHVTQMRRQPGI